MPGIHGWYTQAIKIEITWLTLATAPRATYTNGMQWLFVTKYKQNKGCLLSSLAWPADWSGRAIPDFPSTWTPGRSGVLSMAMYSVADINPDSTTRIRSSTSRVAPHGKQGASYEELCGYWPFSKRMFTPAPRWGSHTRRGAIIKLHYFEIHMIYGQQIYKLSFRYVYPVWVKDNNQRKKKKKTKW